MLSQSPRIDRLLILFFATFLLAGQAVASNQEFQARLHEARWEASSEGMSCILRHEIPHYGRVEFRRQGRKDLSFSVLVKRSPLLQTEAALSSDPPGWKHDAVSRGLDPLEARMTSYPFFVSGAAAHRVFTELEQGMAPSLRYQDWADGMDQVTVTISPLFFRAAQREFLECIRDFSSFGMASASPTRVYFEYDSADLTALGKEVLEQAVSYLKKNRNGMVLVAGHTSSEGTEGYNLSLSRKRAIYVRNFLMQRGIPRDRFDLQFYGEGKPIDDNDTEVGRIRNRRVELRANR